MDGEWTDPQKQEAFKKTPIHTCSPQCNPVENLWDEIREKWYPNQAFQSLQAVEDTLVETLVTLENNNERVQNITGFDWVIRVSRKFYNLLKLNEFFEA